jgi:hypothetical protein
MQLFPASGCPSVSRMKMFCLPRSRRTILHPLPSVRASSAAYCPYEVKEVFHEEGILRGRKAPVRRLFLGAEAVHRRPGGVAAIDVEEGKVVVSYDENEIDPEKLETITRESIRKLGYDVEE